MSQDKMPKRRLIDRFTWTFDDFTVLSAESLPLCERTLVRIPRRRFGYDVAREAASNTIFKAVKALGTPNYFWGRSHKAWLIKVVWHEAIDILRDRRRRHALSLDAVGDVPAVTDGHERACADASVRQAIETLPPEEMRVVTLRYFEGLNREQIASLLGATEYRVRKTLADALDRLRVLLEPVYDFR